MKTRKWKNKNFLQSLKYAMQGIKYVFFNERNLKIQLLFAVFAVVVSVFLKLTDVEWILLCLTIGMVLFAEMLNTAIEIVLDLYSEKYNENIKIAKDISSGAVLLTSIMSVAIGGILWIPKIVNLLK